MKQLLLIGIGPGDPRQITLEAIEALQQADVFFLIDKGEVRRELIEVRRQLIERHAQPGSYRMVQIDDVQRDAQASDYKGAVQAWHEQRAALYARLIEYELAAGEVGAFLLWGEPGLYDSTLRMLDLVRQFGVEIALRVIPGISSAQALAARHAVPLSDTGGSLTIVPGRRLSELAGIDNVLVMLDGRNAFDHIAAEGLYIYWGAYLGSEDEILISGPLQDVKKRIARARKEARARKGWIMDTYLLRRTP
ncbi:precorrin-6A synthase (deacetylating) [Pseudomonas phoenicis]|uniref:precorrin-6A synthase (deacetylating) n=1 Tax=unclassified Pseudomonas TaxID=196821 RepID=UPI0039A20F2B